MPTASSQNFKENHQPLLRTMSHHNTAAGNAALAPFGQDLDQQVDPKQSDKDLMDGFNLETPLSQTQSQSQNDGEKSQDNKNQSDEEWFEAYVNLQSDFDYTGDEDYLYDSNHGGTYYCHICRERVQVVNSFQTQPCGHHFLQGVLETVG
jgi:hypothetical protein